MDQQQAAEVLRNLDQRTKRMEQILPDLPTRAEMRDIIDESIQAAVAPLPARAAMHEAIQAAVAPLPTRAEMHEAIQAAVAPLPTRVEMHEAIQAAVAPLATKEELARAIAPLATKEELPGAIAPLATKEELREGLSDLRDELRGHKDVWAERIHDEVRLAFEAIQGVDEKHTRNFGELRQQIVQLSRTEAQHHAATMKNFEDLREVWRDYVKAHAKDDAESCKSFEKLTGRVEKLESKATRKRRIS